MNSVGNCGKTGRGSVFSQINESNIAKYWQMNYTFTIPFAVSVDDAVACKLVDKEKCHHIAF